MLPLAHMGITITLVRSFEKILGTLKIDYRLLLAASLLPDLIDKPLGYILSTDHSFGTRSLGHSLFFLLYILSIGLFQWYKHEKTCFLILFIGSVVHDTLDRMWYYPKTLLWPFAGNSVIDKFETWEMPIRIGIINTTQLFALEIIGGSILFFFFCWLILQKKMLLFISSGKLAYDDSPTIKYPEAKN